MQKALIPNLNAAPFCDVLQSYADQPGRHPDHVWLVLGSDSNGEGWAVIAQVYARWHSEFISEVGADFTTSPNCPADLRGRIGIGERAFRDVREVLAWVVELLKERGVTVYKRGEAAPIS